MTIDLAAITCEAARTITLPEDKPRTRRRPNPEPELVSAETIQQTLAEYERLAIGTGEWNGTDAPEFSDDGEHWSTAWLPISHADLNGDRYPLLARATVWRKGVKRPTVVVIRWEEALPAIEEWRALWLRKPVTLFGAFALRAALRRAFRDVIGDRREPDEHDTPTTDEGADQ